MQWPMVLFILAFSMSCSMFKSQRQMVIERTIASIEPNQIKVDEVNGTIFVTALFEVLGKSKGNNTFEIQLPYRLQNDLDHDLSYDVMINSSDVECMDNGSLEVLEKNYHYRRTGWSYNNNMKCAYNGMEEKKVVSITFAFQKLKPLSIEDANLFVHPVNDASRDALRILKEVKKGNSVHYLSSRLLYDVLAAKKEVVIQANHENAIWSMKLNKNDVLRIENPRGQIEVPGAGGLGHIGFESKKFNKSGSAGKKFTEKEEIRPYELFCRITQFDGREYVRHFRWDNKLDIYDAKEVKCGINQKKISARKLKKLKGQFELSLSHVSYVSLEKKINDFLQEPQHELDQYIKRINESNIEIVKSHGNKLIENQLKVIGKESLLAERFPYTIEKEFNIEKVEITNRAQIATLKTEGVIYKYIDLNVFAKPILSPSNQIEEGVQRSFSPGELYLGKLLTNKLVNGDEDLYDYYVYQKICGKEFAETFIPNLKAQTIKNEQNTLTAIAFDEFKSIAKNNYFLDCSEQSSGPTVLVLKRVKLQKCGELSAYQKQVARHSVEKAQIMFTHVVASYDLFEGVQKGYQLEYYNLYEVKHPLVESQLVKTDMDLKETKSCLDISEDEALKLLGN